MSVVSLRLPEYLHEAIKELAVRERVTINQLLTLAAAEKVAALMAEDYLIGRARRGDRAAFERVLAKVPAVEPEAPDRIREEGTVYETTDLSAAPIHGHKPAFDRVWERIVKHQGQEFRQRRGKTFTYVIHDIVLVPDLADTGIYQSQFEQAYMQVPFRSVADVPKQLWGRSYLYAILMDDRIRQNDW